MVFSISEFSATIARKGLAKNNLFYVVISLPPGLANLEETVSSRDLTFLCKGASLPAFDIGTTDIHNQGFGRVEKRPTSFNSAPLSLTFMVDSQFGTMKFLHRWVQSVVNFNTMQGYHQEDKQGKTPYEFAYKTDYAATISVILYSGNSGDQVYMYEFGNAYPIVVGNVESDWGNQGEVMIQTAAFEYDKFSVTGAEVGAIRPELSMSNGYLTYISAINGVGQTIRQSAKSRNILDIVNTITNVNTIFNKVI